MIADFRNKHKGETALVIGNGPSLDDAPLRELSQKYVTFGANKIFLYPFTPTYWTCVDYDMLHDCLPLPDGFEPEAKFVPLGVPLRGAQQLPLKIAASFSDDVEQVAYIGGTVTYVNLQLAKYMGFKRVLLLGVDHKYPKSGNGKPGSRFIADGDDPDHFGNGYFSFGRMYNRPELDVVDKSIYPLANRAFKGEIVNLTKGTAATAFQTGDAKDWL